MARTPPLLMAWMSYILMFSSAFILLGSISASQRFCGRSSANAITNAGGAGYFANVSCDKLYKLAWFTTWYQIAMTLIVPIVLSMGGEFFLVERSPPTTSPRFTPQTCFLFSRCVFLQWCTDGDMV